MKEKELERLKQVQDALKEIDKAVVYILNNGYEDWDAYSDGYNTNRCLLEDKLATLFYKVAVMHMHHDISLDRVQNIVTKMPVTKKEGKVGDLI